MKSRNSTLAGLSGGHLRHTICGSRFHHQRGHYRKLGECGSLDFHSYNLDNTANKRMGWDPIPYMTLDNATDRYGEGEKALKMTPKEKDAVQNIVVASVPFGR